MTKLCQFEAKRIITNYLMAIMREWVVFQCGMCLKGLFSTTHSRDLLKPTKHTMRKSGLPLYSLMFNND